MFGRTGKIVVAMIVAAVTIGGLIRWVARNAMEREDTLHAVGFTCELVEKHLDKTGRWPASWEDLTIVEPRRYSTYRWPEDLPLLKRRVRLDFGISDDDLVDLDPNSFSAIGPREDSYPSWKGNVRELALKCRDRIREKRAATGVR